ncbi:MAG: hypothetical protein OXU36_22120 [Candidatus Poribacteria bacterium]|nr:hypothetical protein [Candidatus Poribacteria bacterium]
MNHSHCEARMRVNQNQIRSNGMNALGHSPGMNAIEHSPDMKPVRASPYGIPRAFYGAKFVFALQ